MWNAVSSVRLRQKYRSPAAAIRMYAPMIWKVAVVAMNPKYLKGSFHTIRASTTTSPSVSASYSPIAAHCVPNRGCVHANLRGIPPSRAIANTVRAVRFTPGERATNAPTDTARSTITASQCRHICPPACPAPPDRRPLIDVRDAEADAITH